jgi:arylsulfatase
MKYLLLSVAIAGSALAKPNFVIIFADDLGYSDAGCYGGEISTPNLDKLAAGGLRFTQFYNTARCWPSRGALMTGYYAQQIRRDALPGVPGGGQGIRPKWARLIPEMLRPLGYRNYHSGKWHIDGKQLENGFDRAYCAEDHNRNFNPQKHTEDDVNLPKVAPGGNYYSTTAITDYAIKYLKDHAANHADKPFFTYLCYIVPHFPLQAPAEDIAKYKNKYNVGWDAVREARYDRMKKLGIANCPLSTLEREVGPPYHFPDAFEKLGLGEARFPVPWRELSDAQRKFQADKMSVHAAMVHRMDTEIGRVVEQLRAMKALDDTLILFLSDNGASAEIMVRGDGHDPKAAPGSAGSYLCLGPGWSSAANTPLRRHKTWVHEGGIATSFIAHWPQGISARGELRHNPAHLIDIAPTIVELAGGKWTDGAPPSPGRSLAPAFAKDGAVSHDYLWWLHENNRAVRVGDWKLVSAEKQGGDWELYDLKTDRSETTNLAAKNPDKVKELSAVWEQRADEFRALALKDMSAAPAKKPGKKKKGK